MDGDARPLARVSRRQVLVAALSGATLAACSSGTVPSSTSSTSASSASGIPPSSAAPSDSSSAPTPTGTATAVDPAAALPATHRWVARRGEVEPSVKRQATDLVEAVGAWTRGGGDLRSARARARKAGFDPALADALAPLLGGGEAAAVQVRDAQYGGLLTSSASVLVVVDQWRADSAGRVTAGGTTVDVRLVAASPRWRVVDAFPARPGPASSRLTAAARSVLAADRIRLPHAAHADVRAGRIHDSVLSVLLALSREHVVDVSVLRSGHPLLVFGTSRPSDHPRGRAADVWALDGKPLVLPANHGLATSGMRFAVAHGAYNVGGPVQLSGPEYFSDRTHQDHIHLGFDH